MSSTPRGKSIRFSCLGLITWVLVPGCGGDSGGHGDAAVDAPPGSDGNGAGGTAGAVGFDASIDLNQPTDYGLVFGTALPPGSTAQSVVPSSHPFPGAGLQRADTGADVVPGRLIISFRPGHEHDAAGLHGWKGLESYRFAHHSHIGPGMVTVDTADAARSGRAIGRDETQELARRLAQHPDIAVVDVDRVLHRVALPNDPAIPAMWDLRLSNIPGAWDIDTGSASTVVAVVDDGVKAHPDLPPLLPGYDFITDPDAAADGDGRDPDPSPEPFVDPTEGIVVWHGEHVSGTIGAIANNASGIAGINWRCRILPVRVLGKGGAASSDVIAGLYWAAGFPVPGVPDNPNPAQVINLSLGSKGLGTAEQKAVDDITAKGVVIVAAAGNDNVDASDWSYAGYDGVIGVGALDRLGRRAAYSNFGSKIAVMAPGGDMDIDADGDGEQDGIISLWFTDDGKSPILSMRQGTSMATPHVTGVVSLMLGINPSLTPAQVTSMLKSTADPSGQCAEGCGAGAMNAAAALLAAKGSTDWAQAPALELASDRLHVTGAGAKLGVMNAGGGTLTWSLDLAGPQANTLVATPTSGSVAAKSSASVTFTVDGGGLATGYHTTYVRVNSNGGSRVVPVSFVVGSPSVHDIGFAFAFMYDGKAQGTTAGATFTSAGLGYTFFIKTSPGSWFLAGWDDLNNDGKMDTGDLWGAYPSTTAAQQIDVKTGDLLGPYQFSFVPL